MVSNELQSHYIFFHIDLSFMPSSIPEIFTRRNFNILEEHAFMFVRLHTTVDFSHNKSPHTPSSKEGTDKSVPLPEPSLEHVAAIKTRIRHLK